MKFTTLLLVFSISGYSIDSNGGKKSRNNKRLHQGVSNDVVELELLEPSQRAFKLDSFPATTAVVFKNGRRRAGLNLGAIKDDLGNFHDFDVEDMEWWSADKNFVRWINLRFKVSSGRKYFFHENMQNPFQNQSANERGRILARVNEDKIVVATGPLRARFTNGSSKLFDFVLLDRKRMIKHNNYSIHLEKFVDSVSEKLKFIDVEQEIERNGRYEAVIKRSGYFVDANAHKIAKLILRYTFKKDETFIKIDHSFVWMIRDPNIGAKAISLGVLPNLEKTKSTINIGISEYGPGHKEIADLLNFNSISIEQLEADSYSLNIDDNRSIEQGHAGGWMSMTDGEGYGVGVSLKDFWQTYPSSLAYTKNGIGINMWPAVSDAMTFRPVDLMGSELFYNTSIWDAYDWMKPVGHFVHENASNSKFLHTGEGASRSSEILLHFYRKDSNRETWQLNSINQQPIIVRQDPVRAVSLPIEGIHIPVKDVNAYPDIERSLDSLGKMVTKRWSQNNDFGFWRYGFMRWGSPMYGMYRWMDGVQYNQQMIPWILFVRGGDRRDFEEAETVTKFARDVVTNHYNTRDWPIGYQGQAGGMPLPWHAAHTTKATKLGFLRMHYNLTGDLRTKEVIREVIDGTLEAARRGDGYPEDATRGRGRSLYNLNGFWVDAMACRPSVEIMDFAKEWIDLTFDREYSPAANSFRSPIVYLYDGIAKHINRFGLSEAHREKLVTHLAGRGYMNLENSGVFGVAPAVLIEYLANLNNSNLQGRLAWDIARILSDTVPEYDWENSAIHPKYAFSQHHVFRGLLLPILSGLKQAQLNTYTQATPIVVKDTFLPINYKRATNQGLLYLRSKKSGLQSVEILLYRKDLSNATALTAELTPEISLPVSDVDLFEPINLEVIQPPPSLERWSHIGGRFHRTTLDFDSSQPGEIIKLDLSSNDGRDRYLIVGDVDYVQKFGSFEHMDTYQLSGQYHMGSRLITRMVDDVLTIWRPKEYEGYTIRDAFTRKLLFRSNSVQPVKMEINIGRDRLVEITFSGEDRQTFAMKGNSGYVSTSVASYFEPK